MNFYNKSIKEIYKELKSSADGLTTEEAVNRKQLYGENKLVEKKGKSPLSRFFSQFNDMMIIILIVVAVIMGIYGILYSHDYTDTIVITVVVLINAIMGFIQEQKAEVTLAGLKDFTSSTCKVRRDGTIKVIATEELVPGDIIILEAGDKVPADARVITENNLSVDEAPLTGESIPVKKVTRILKGTLQIQDQTNMLFSGCSITNGKVEAIVTRTGMLTELGLIAVSLNTPYEVATPLQLKINEISKKITLLIFVILIFIFIYGVLNDYKILEIIMLCVSLAVAAIPEGLPAVITITLSGGAGALAKKKTVVRQMSAVETLGSTDIICSDKTGTITKNKMTVKKVIALNEKMFNNVIALCNETIIDNGSFIGDPTETCLYEYLLEQKVEPLKLKEQYIRIIDAPFDSNRKMMSSVNKIDGKNYLLTKGSLENILENCTHYCENNKVKKLTASVREEILKQEASLANKALRVIGTAYKELSSVPKNAASTIKEEQNLVYVGMVGMIDPPRESVKESVKKCQQAGIRPIMITGDSLITACAIAREVGIIKKTSEGILGSELDKYTDEELKEVVKKYNVYARVSPDHKRRIVAAWQANEKVVAMTGDGVNDAPAIKDAHVGVGMGITGTEVTKSVADVILLDDSFSTIVTAVEEGRRIFNNIRNNVVYSLSSNFAEIFAVLVGLLTGNTILLPIHILFIDLVTDSVPCICLAFEKSEKGVMECPPRGKDKPLFTPFIYANVIGSSIIETVFVLVTFFYTKSLYGAEVAMTASLLALVIQELVYAYSCRNLKNFIHNQGFFSNKTLNIGMIAILAIELLVFLTPLGRLIDIVAVDLSVLIKIVLFNIISFVLYEMVKPIFCKYFKD